MPRHTKTSSLVLKIILFLFALNITVSLPGLQISCFGAKTAAPLNQEFYDKIRALKPLPKIHYSWGLNDQFKDYGKPLLYQLARITHSLSVKGEWVTKPQIDLCVRLCAKVNQTNPKIPSTIGINFSPWHRKFGKDLPSTDRGTTYYAEIAFLKTRLKKIKRWVAQSNLQYQSNVQVGALLLDCERFYVKKGNKAWNEGMREALDAIHLTGQKVFPKARIEWYGRGMRAEADGDGWGKTPLFTGGEILTSLSCSLYSIPELERTHELYRRTVKLANEMGIKPVTPWIALASGHRRGMIKTFYWDNNWDYDLIYSYQIGAALNNHWHAARPQLFAPYDRAEVIIFFPAPFERNSPQWGKHFIAYVRGANLVKQLSDLGFTK